MANVNVLRGSLLKSGSQQTSGPAATADQQSIIGDGGSRFSPLQAIATVSLLRPVDDGGGARLTFLGQPLYVDSDGVIRPAIANSSLVEASVFALAAGGYGLNANAGDWIPGSSVGPVDPWLTAGSLDIPDDPLSPDFDYWATFLTQDGAELIPGAYYYLSASVAGKITAVKPSAPGQYVTQIGQAISQTQMMIRIVAPVQIPPE